jgi:hypothetical protein
MRRSALLVAVVAMVAGCTTAGGGDTTTTTTLAETTRPSEPLPGVETTAPADRVRAQLDWFVGVMNGDELTEEAYTERFTEVFRAQVGFEDQFLPIVAQLESVQGDWVVVDYQAPASGAAVAVVAAGDERVRVSINVDPEQPDRISGLFVQPADLPSAPDSFENAIGRLGELGTVRLLAAEVVDGSCVPVAEQSSGEAAPLGSVFKLYVLGTLAQAVEAGEVAWDDEIVIRDELKSIPSGILQDEPDGTVKTVREVATLMISISDNTATDHLIDLLGRERIEAALPGLGLSTPDLNIPFLTTFELSALKIGPAEGLRGGYLEADEAGRRAILDQIGDLTPDDLPIMDFLEPIDPDRLEWFSSPADLCSTLAVLWEMGARPGLEPVREILTQNPGVAPEPGLWEQVAFKGGSEPGLLAVAWLVVDADGRVFTLTGSVVNPDEVIDDSEAVFVLAGARDLLAAGG